ncbi:MAG: hypothetical protein GY852_07325 [bacterium]|nr:hypothetical protein [bacterium]
MMKKLLLLLVMISLSFSVSFIGVTNWQTLSLLAAFTAFMVLIILYMISYLVDSKEMRIMVRGELFQVFITIMFIALFVSVDGYSNALISGGISEAFGETSANHIDYAMAILEEGAEYQWDVLKTLTNNLTIPLGSMASTSATCGILGASFSYPGCIGIQVPFSSLMFATNVLVSAMLANNSQIILLNLAQSFFFPIMLPLGLFLRCFQFTRGAGGLLIAIAVAFYFIFPISIILTTAMANKVNMDDPRDHIPDDIEYPSDNFGSEFTAGLGSAGDIVAAIATGGVSMLFAEIKSECNPLDMDANAGRKQAKRLVGDGGGEMVDSLLYLFFVQGLFSTMLNILITLSAVRGLSKVFGTEVDISALARIS